MVEVRGLNRKKGAFGHMETKVNENEKNHVSTCVIIDSPWQRVTNPEEIRTAQSPRPGELLRPLASAG